MEAFEEALDEGVDIGFGVVELLGEGDVAGEVGEDDSPGEGSSQAPDRMLTCWPCSAIQTRRTSKDALSREAAGGMSRNLLDAMGALRALNLF